MRLNQIRLAHLDGTANIIDVSFLSASLNPNVRPRYSLGEMFFKPYESKKEARFCAQHTFLSGIVLGAFILCPITLIFPLVLVGMSTAGLIVSGIEKAMGNQEKASRWLDFAERALTVFCYFALKVASFPVAVLALMTRGLSTGLKEAHIYDYDASNAQVNPA